MLNRIVWIGLMTLVLAPVPTFAQNAPAAPAAPGASAPAIPNRTATGTHRAREKHRRTLNRQRARATSEHVRQTRTAPNR